MLSTAGINHPPEHLLKINGVWLPWLPKCRVVWIQHLCEHVWRENAAVLDGSFVFWSGHQQLPVKSFVMIRHELKSAEKIKKEQPVFSLSYSTSNEAFSFHLCQMKAHNNSVQQVQISENISPTFWMLKRRSWIIIPIVDTLIRLACLQQFYRCKLRGLSVPLYRSGRTRTFIFLVYLQQC